MIVQGAAVAYGGGLLAAASGVLAPFAPQEQSRERRRAREEAVVYGATAGGGAYGAALAWSRESYPLLNFGRFRLALSAAAAVAPSVAAGWAAYEGWRTRGGGGTPAAAAAAGDASASVAASVLAPIFVVSAAAYFAVAPAWVATSELCRRASPGR